MAAATGLSLATVATLVGELLDLGMLTEVGFEDSAGPPPRTRGRQRVGGALIGVDIAETYVRVELFDLALNVLARAAEDMRPGESRPEQVVGHVAAAVGSVVAQAGVEGARVLGVGVSVPGQVDRDTGISEYAPNWDWHDVPLLDLLAEHIAYPSTSTTRCAPARSPSCGSARPAVAGTPSSSTWARGRCRPRARRRAAPRGEQQRGRVGPYDAGPRRAAVPLRQPRLRGDVRRGARNHAEPAGVEPAEPAAAPRRPDRHHRRPVRGVAAGDPVALQVVRDTARYLGASIADLINLLNPEVVVLSSWVAAALGEPLLREVREAVARHALRRPLAATEIVLSPSPPTRSAWAPRPSPWRAP